MANLPKLTTTTQFDRLGTDILESLGRESCTARDLHGRLQPIYRDALNIDLDLSMVQNAVDGLVRSRLIRFVGMNRDLMVPASSGRGALA